MKDKYYSRVARALCPNCPSKTDNSHTYCFKCRVKRAQKRMGERRNEIEGTQKEIR